MYALHVKKKLLQYLFFKERSMKAFIQLIQQNSIVRNLLISQFMCFFGAWFIHTAIYALLIDLDAPIWAITVTAALTFFPGVVFAPLTGAIVDTIPTKKLLITMLLIEIITALLLFFADSLEWLWFLFVLLFIRMSAATIFFQAGMSIFPKILAYKELKLANELNSIVWSLAYTSGMAIAGVFVHFYGVDLAIFTNVVLYGIGVFILLQTPIPEVVKKVKTQIFQSMKEGFCYVKKHKLIVHLMLLHASVGLTTYDALIALLAKFNYPLILSAALVIGLINASRSIGLFIGTFILSPYVNTKTLPWVFVAQGVGIILWAFLQFNFYLGLLGSFIAGFFTTILWSYTYTLLQNETDTKFYGRVIAYNDMTFLGFSTLISLIVGFLYKNGVSAFGITLLLGSGFFLFALYYIWIRKKYPHS